MVSCPLWQVRFAIFLAAQEREAFSYPNPASTTTASLGSQQAHPNQLYHLIKLNLKLIPLNFIQFKYFPNGCWVRAVAMMPYGSFSGCRDMANIDPHAQLIILVGNIENGTLLLCFLFLQSLQV